MSEAQAVPALFVVARGDNVAIAGRPIAAGEVVTVEGTVLTSRSAIPLAHKIALQAIPAGGKVIRCAVPIGSATRDIAAGEHVHTQNLASDYIPTYTLDGPLRFGRAAA